MSNVVLKNTPGLATLMREHSHEWTLLADPDLGNVIQIEHYKCGYVGVRSIIDLDDLLSLVYSHVCEES